MPTEDEITAAADALFHYFGHATNPGPVTRDAVATMLQAAEDVRTAAFNREVARMNHKEPS